MNPFAIPPILLTIASRINSRHVSRGTFGLVHKHETMLAVQLALRIGRNRRIGRVTDALPQHCPTPRELDDLELIAHGAVPAELTDDPQGVTLTLPSELAGSGTVELVDPEGLPLAQVTIERTY